MLIGDFGVLKSARNRRSVLHSIYCISATRGKTSHIHQTRDVTSPSFWVQEGWKGKRKSVISSVSIYHIANVRHTYGGQKEVESPTGEGVPGDSHQEPHCHHGGCSYDGHPCVEKRDKSTINSPLIYNTNIRHTLGGATEVGSPTGEEVPGDSRQELHCHHGGCPYDGHPCEKRQVNEKLSIDL